MSYLNSLFSLEKKVAVVTGGTGVLGAQDAEGVGAGAGGEAGGGGAGGG